MCAATLEQSHEFWLVAAGGPDQRRGPGWIVWQIRLSAALQQQLGHRALSELTSEQISVLRLSFFQDCPHSEIAETLGLPLGTVKSRIRLALQKLRAALEGEK